MTPSNLLGRICFDKKKVFCTREHIIMTSTYIAFSCSACRTWKCCKDRTAYTRLDISAIGCHFVACLTWKNGDANVLVFYMHIWYPTTWVYSLNQRCPVIVPNYQLTVLDLLLPGRLVHLTWVVATCVHRGCYHRTCAHTKNHSRACFPLVGE